MKSKHGKFDSKILYLPKYYSQTSLIILLCSAIIFFTVAHLVTYSDTYTTYIYVDYPSEKKILLKQFSVDVLEKLRDDSEVGILIYNTNNTLVSGSGSINGINVDLKQVLIKPSTNMEKILSNIRNPVYCQFILKGVPKSLLNRIFNKLMHV